MTTYGIKPPESFDVHHPENWTKWSKRFEQFRVASGLSGAVAAKQVSTFLYCFGESAEDLLSAMGATDADRATYAGIKERFDTYFKVRHNAVYERACFNRRTFNSRARVPKTSLLLCIRWRTDVSLAQTGEMNSSETDW